MQSDVWKRNLFLRHYVRDMPTFEALELGAERVKEAVDVARRADNNIDFIPHVTIDGQTIDPRLQERVERVVKDLQSSVDVEYHTTNGGAGEALRQALFSRRTAGVPTINFCGDLDQYKFFTEDGQWAITELALNMEHGEKLVGIGSRDVPVVLGTNTTPDNLRKIDEHYKSLAIGPAKLKIPHEHRSKVTPAYRRMGECVPGFYGINTANPNYPLLESRVERAAHIAGLKGCAADAFIVIAGAELGGIARGYVPSFPNEFYGNKGELQELESVAKTLYREANVLGQTDIGQSFLDAVRSPKNKALLERFYSKQEVALVQTLLESGLQNHPLPASYLETAPARYADALAPLAA